jgi:hypothetical protein
MKSRIGVSSLCVLLCSFFPAYYIGRYEVRFCFTRVGHDWLWWVVQFSAALLFFSVFGAIAGLVWDKEKSVAAIALVLWFPLALLGIIAGACP